MSWKTSCQTTRPPTEAGALIAGEDGEPKHADRAMVHGEAWTPVGDGTPVGMWIVWLVPG
jgi:hypothetical protein